MKTRKTPCKYLTCKGLLLKLVPRPGLEPGWVAPLVFETSASTDSAIWASKAVQRYKIILNYK